VKPRSAKNKGARFQKEVAAYLSELTGIPFEKDGDIDVRTMGNSGTDIILRGKACEKIPFSIECKNVEKLNLWAAWEQANNNSTEEMPALLIVRRNRTKPFVCIDMESFFRRVL